MLTTHQPQGDEAALGQPHWGLDHQTTVYKESLWSTLQVAGSSSLQGHLAIAWPQIALPTVTAGPIDQNK